MRTKKINPTKSQNLAKPGSQRTKSGMERNVMEKDVAYYLSLPYAAEITPVAEDEGGGYAACIPLLGRWSAVGDGETAEQAYADLRAALPSLIGDWLERGVEIPEPAAAPEDDQPLLSGKLSLRLPRSLHTQAARAAEKEGVSINQLIAVALAREIGTRHLVQSGRL